ncbi:MAG: relaxase/mobilization nuclease domain-containing protein [Desulfitobacteriaceae bacterium]|nr:relaxase/mobilization nuclease domain-containing protein [Desulfitobacteriaceae bacterium]
MIAKNIKGKSFKGCVSYVMNDTATLLETEGVFADSTRNMIHSFAMQRSGRKEIKQPVGHIPISFSPEDKPRMTDDFMLQLAKEYMQEMGIKNTQYIIVRHHNTDNDHLHIVYNRIDNGLKLISVNQDYKRNIKICKKLKDKYNLAYGRGKEKVKREKLDNPDKVKYKIHDAIKTALPYCKSEKDLQTVLGFMKIKTEFKLKRNTNEIEGISFSLNNISFKGSQIDRKFSFGNLRKEFEKNRQTQEKQQLEKKKQQERQEKQVSEKPKKYAPPTKRNLVLLGVELSPEQEKVLKAGGYIFLENMTNKDGKSKFSSYIFLNDEKDRVFSSKENPDSFVKHGKYEMRIRDKILVEKGYVTQVKVKWYGIGTFAYPYLWKDNIADVEYKESWNDPRVPKEEKTQREINKRQNISDNLKKSRDKRI